MTAGTVNKHKIKTTIFMDVVFSIREMRKILYTLEARYEIILKEVT